MDDFIELGAEGFTAVLETDIGDQALHFVTNAKRRESNTKSQVDRTGRSKGSGSRQGSPKESGSRHGNSKSSGSRQGSIAGDGKDQDRRSHRDDHRRSERTKDASQWSLGSYWRSKRQIYDKPRTRRNESPPEDWSKKSYLQNRRHQQQQLEVTPEQIDEEYEKRMTEEAREAARLLEQRRDQFRVVKSAYVPHEAQTVTELKWDENRLYDDVGRAVQDAMRRSGELDRRRPR